MDDNDLFTQAQRNLILDIWEEKSGEMQAIAVESAKELSLQTIKTVLSEDLEVRKKIHEREMSDIQAMIRQASLLKSENMRLMKETEESIKNIFATGEFTENIRKEFMRIIDQEIGVRFSQEGLVAYIQHLMTEEINNHLQEYTTNVVSSIVTTTNHNLRKEYERTQKLVCSIDSEIKHLTMRLPISAIDEERMREVISKSLEQFTGDQSKAPKQIDFTGKEQ